jgi:membrane protease YdiL (CAAX protease family)
MNPLIIETIKMAMVVAILIFIAKFRHTKPVCDPFFADQKWTLSDAYKILLPVLIAVFLLFVLSELVPSWSLKTRLLLQLITNSLWCVAIYVLFHVVIKTPYDVTATTFGLQTTEFLRAAVLPTNVVTILFLVTIPAVNSKFQLKAHPYTQMEILSGLLLMAMSVFVAPLLEELLWRGILYPPVIKRMPKWQTITCLCFAESLSHVQANVEMVGLFLTFLFLYFVYDKSKSLYSSIILHIGLNFIAARPVIEALLSTHIDRQALGIFFICIVLFFAFCINLAWFLWKKGNPGKTSSSAVGAGLGNERTHTDASGPG